MKTVVIETDWLKDKLAALVKVVEVKDATDTRGAIRDCMTDLLKLAEENGMDSYAREQLIAGAKEVLEEEDGVPATYISVWDNDVTIRSACRYFPDLKVVRNIEKSDTDTGDAQLVSEAVELVDEFGDETELGAKDGVEFEY
jgi:hypothetical protein